MDNLSARCIYFQPFPVHVNIKQGSWDKIINDIRKYVSAPSGTMVVYYYYLRLEEDLNSFLNMFVECVSTSI